MPRKFIPRCLSSSSISFGLILLPYADANEVTNVRLIFFFRLNE